MNESRQPPQPSDRGSVLIAASIIGAALVLSWGISSSQPRYQIAAAGDTVVRMDTDSGEIIACNQQRCARVEPPDRAKTFGPLTIQYESKPEPALPASEPQQNGTGR
jgi:hypothetical protein